MTTFSETQVVALVEELTVEHLRIWVREGWIAPRLERKTPVYDEIDVARIRLVCELKHEMAVNDEALPVILKLVDQVYGLRRELRVLGRAIEQQPKSVRERITRALDAPEDG